MKIAFFIPVIAGRGGIESVVANLLQQLDADGDDARLFIYSGSRDKEWLQQLPWVREIGSPQQPRPVRLWTYFRQAIHHLRQWKPDAIVCTHPSTLRLARFCRRILRLKNVPVALWLHGPLSVHERIEEALPLADGHICICQERADEVKQALAQWAPGLDPPICVAYNGTSVGKKYSVEPAPIPTFVYIGRLLFEDQKRVGDIVEAAGLLRGEFRIRFVGDGPTEDKQRLLKLANEAEITEKLEWLGWQSKPWAAIPAATSLIMASSYEGFSMAIVESLALGLPVICADYQGAREVITADQTGWIFPIGDTAALAAIMQSIVDAKLPIPSVEAVQQKGAKFSTEAMAVSFRSALETMRMRKTA